MNLPIDVFQPQPVFEYVLDPAPNDDVMVSFQNITELENLHELSAPVCHRLQQKIAQTAMESVMIGEKKNFYFLFSRCNSSSMCYFVFFGKIYFFHSAGGPGEGIHYLKKQYLFFQLFDLHQQSFFFF